MAGAGVGVRGYRPCPLLQRSVVQMITDAERNQHTFHFIKMGATGHTLFCRGFVDQMITDAERNQHTFHFIDIGPGVGPSPNPLS